MKRFNTNDRALSRMIRVDRLVARAIRATLKPVKSKYLQDQDIPKEWK